MDNEASALWPEAGSSRVPYELYKSDDIYARERERIFQGATWNYLCLEAELPNPGDYRATHVGDVPVIVARDMDGALTGFENRCAHRGALICPGQGGHGARISCVYHGWTYDLRGNLTAVTFQRGIAGKGGMPADFKREEWKRRALRVESFCGLVFGTFSEAAPPLATLYRRRDRRAHRAGDEEAGEDPGHQQPDPAEQLEDCISAMCAIPITQACCTCSSPPSASTGSRPRAASSSTRAAAIT